MAGALLFYRPGEPNEIATVSLVWLVVLVVTLTGFSLLRLIKWVGLTDLFVFLMIYAAWSIPVEIKETSVLVAGFFGIGAGIFISGQIYGSPDNVVSPMDMPD